MTQTTTRPQIAFDKIGDGEPALAFLPGWCCPRTLFHDLLPLVGRHRTALTLDWRGHGGSDRDVPDFGTGELADDAMSVIDAASLDRVIPVGQAHAGWVALELRRRLGPDRVPGIVLLDWMVPGPAPGFLDAMPLLRAQATWQEVRSGLLGRWTTGVDNEAVLANVQTMATYGFDMWARAAREIEAQFATYGTPVAALETLGCPTLHLYAQPSDDSFLTAQLEFAAEHPWFAVHRLAAKSHFPAVEAPKQAAAEIEKFASQF